MSQRTENVWTLVAALVTVLSGPLAFRHLYQATTMATEASEGFAREDLSRGITGFAIPLALTAMLMVIGLMRWRWTKLGHVLIPVTLSLLIIGILTAESIWLSSRWSEDWIWRGLPAMVTIVPYVVGLLWGRWGSSRQITALLTGVTSALLVAVLLGLLIPRFWLHDPVLQSTRIDRIDRDLPRFRLAP